MLRRMVLWLKRMTWMRMAMRGSGSARVVSMEQRMNVGRVGSVVKVPWRTWPRDVPVGARICSTCVGEVLEARAEMERNDSEGKRAFTRTYLDDNPAPATSGGYNLYYNFHLSSFHGFSQSAVLSPIAAGRSVARARLLRLWGACRGR